MQLDRINVQSGNGRARELGLGRQSAVALSGPEESNRDVTLNDATKAHTTKRTLHEGKEGSQMSVRLHNLGLHHDVNGGRGKVLILKVAASCIFQKMCQYCLTRQDVVQETKKWAEWSALSTGQCGQFRPFFYFPCDIQSSHPVRICQPD